MSVHVPAAVGIILIVLAAIIVRAQAEGEVAVDKRARLLTRDIHRDLCGWKRSPRSLLASRHDRHFTLIQLPLPER
jgi:hypothetical protein